jgi:hypothetical protein
MTVLQGAIEELSLVNDSDRATAIERFVKAHPDLAGDAEREALERGRAAGGSQDLVAIRYWGVASDLAKAYRRQAAARAPLTRDVLDS